MVFLDVLSYGMGYTPDASQRVSPASNPDRALRMGMGESALVPVLDSWAMGAEKNVAASAQDRLRQTIHIVRTILILEIFPAAGIFIRQTYWGMPEITPASSGKTGTFVTMEPPEIENPKTRTAAPWGGRLCHLAMAGYTLA
jgi:hypothetical protein